MKKTISALLALCSLCGCSTAQEGVSKLPDSTDTDASALSNYDILTETDSFTNECSISLGNDIKINGEGAWIDDNCVKISESGVYTVEGQIDDGMIYVECPDVVKIILKDTEIINKDGAALISQSKKLILECPDRTVNYFTDSKDYSYSREFENKNKHEAAIYTEGDLYITGGGSISVTGNLSEGITCGGNLFANNVSFGIGAEDNGVKSGGDIAAECTEITIVCEKDGMKADGGIILSDCTADITAGNDAVQAESALTAANSVLSVCTFGDILADAELSSKGFKSSDMTFNDCIVSVAAVDHAFKATGAMKINGGTFSVSSSAGKGFTADGDISLGGAEINVSASGEGIESKASLTIESGSVSISSQEDGINTGGDDLSADHSMNITGGTVIINADGDGLDSNGDINISGGTVVIFGPVSDANTAVDWGDFGFSLNVTGGKLFALGSSGMMNTPRSNCKAVRSLNADEGDRVTVTDGSGNVILSLQTPKAAQGLLFSDGTAAEGYKIWLGGTADGEADENGMITGGTIEGGTEAAESGTGGFSGGMHPNGGRQNGGRKPDGEAPTMGERPEIPELPQAA